MQPVRIVTQGADPTLPLRMVAAGVGANVGLELYVITEGRYHPQNFPDEQLDFTKLTWDVTTSSSNYELLATAALQRDGGKGWLTEFSGQPELVATGNYGPTFNGGAPANPGLADAYLSLCQSYAPLPPCDAGASPDGGGGGGGGGDAASTDGPSEGGEGDAAMVSDAASDAPATPPACPQNPANSCEFFDDLKLATAGLHPDNVWVTRMRSFLPASALTGADLVLEPAPLQAPMASLHHTDAFANNYSPCPKNAPQPAGASQGGGCACGVTPKLRARVGTYFLMTLTLLGLSMVMRRRRA
jgi:hypothetical protein